jgi:hypothetical protein
MKGAAMSNDAGQPVATQGSAAKVLDPQKVATGQRVIIASMVIVLIAIGVDMTVTHTPATSLFTRILNVTTIIVSIVGSVMLCRALGYSVVIMIVCVLGMFIPLGNLIVLGLLNDRAMKFLRAAGWKVGFLGSSKPAQ